METTWHAATIEQLISILSRDEAVCGLIQIGSHASMPSQVDAWSDIDLMLVVADAAITQFHPATAWLEAFGTVYAVDSGTCADYGTVRTFYTDGRHIDWVIAGESSFTRIDTWAANPLAHGSLVLYAASEHIRHLGERTYQPAPLTNPSDADFVRLVNAFRFKGMLAVTKAARNEMLVALHLSLDLVRDCLLLAMWLRDRNTGTDHHRDGSQGNPYIPVIQPASQPYTREGVLASIAQSAEAFDRLATEWSPEYQPNSQPLFEVTAQARELLSQGAI